MLIETPKRAKKSTHTSNQRKQMILSFVHEYRRVKGYSPKYEEIASGIGFSDTSEGTVWPLVQELIQEGWMKNEPGIARSLLPLRSPTDVYCEITDIEFKRIIKQQRNLRILRRL